MLNLNHFGSIHCRALKFGTHEEGLESILSHQFSAKSQISVSYPVECVFFCRACLFLCISLTWWQHRNACNPQQPMVGWTGKPQLYPSIRPFGLVRHVCLFVSPMSTAVTCKAPLIASSICITKQKHPHPTKQQHKMCCCVFWRWLILDCWQSRVHGKSLRWTCVASILYPSHDLNIDFCWKNMLAVLAPVAHGRCREPPTPLTQTHWQPVKKTKGWDQLQKD